MKKSKWPGEDQGNSSKQYKEALELRTININGKENDISSLTTKYQNQRWKIKKPIYSTLIADHRRCKQMRNRPNNTAKQLKIEYLKRSSAGIEDDLYGR